MGLPKGAFNGGDIIAYRRLFWDYQPATVVEIGCWQGRSLCSAAEVIKRLKIRVIAIDDFSQVCTVDTIEGNVREVFLENIERYGLKDYVELLEGDSVECAMSCDMAFIDADHWNVKRDIEAWEHHAKIVLAGHDYVKSGGSAMYDHVRKVVEEHFGTRVRKYPQTVAPMNKIWFIEK